MRYLIILIILLLSCSYKSNNRLKEKFFNSLAFNDINTLETIDFNKVKINNWKDINKTLYLSKGKITILKILKNKKLLISPKEIYKRFGKEAYLKANYYYSFLKIDQYYELGFDYNYDLFEIYNNKKIFLKENFKYKFKKLLQTLPKKNMTFWVDLICDYNHSKENLIFWESIIGKLNYNLISKKYGSTIFGCYTEGNFIDWSAIKHIIKNGGNWNIKRDFNNIQLRGKLNNKNYTETPFYNFIHWKDLTLDMVIFAIKTGAKWDINYSKNLLSKIIAEHHESITKEFLIFAHKTGAILNDNQALFIKNKEVRDYLMKLRKESK